MEEFMYEDSDGESRLHGSAYGRYLRDIPHDQINRVISMLEENPDTRRAIINIHQAGVEDYDKGDVACTIYLHPIIRDGKLHMTANMRSQDMLWGYPYDTQAFQWIQEVIAGILDVDLGSYTHIMNSCHYYTDREDEVLASAEQCTAARLPDCRLDQPEIDVVMEAMRRGLKSTRDGIIPTGAIGHIEHISDFYADWLRLMTAYEQIRFHDDREDNMKAAHILMESMETNALAKFVNRKLSSNTNSS